MPQFVAEIEVMPLKALLDPQGKAVLMGLKNMNINSIQDVAHKVAEAACKQLLHNPIMENYQITIK